MPHKAYVVMKKKEILKGLIHHLLALLGGEKIILIARLMPHQQIHSAPEACSPDEGTHGFVPAVLPYAVNELVSGSESYCALLIINGAEGILDPLSVFFKKFFYVFHF